MVSLWYTAKGITVRKLFHLLFSSILALSLFLGSAPVQADPEITQADFLAYWQRADKPVLNGTAQPPRSWLWGPQSYPLAVGGSFIPYYDSPNGMRQVLFFDKTRMELNNP